MLSSVPDLHNARAALMKVAARETEAARAEFVSPRPGLPVALALQGGGAFGAYTWGVLDRLLEPDGPRLEALSGASAGAINAVVLASGLLEGGPEGGREEARRRLDRFWNGVAGSAARVAPAEPLDGATLLISPYLLNPLNLNPVRDLLADIVDFDRLRADPPTRLLISATRVRDGGLRIFREHEITLEVVLASSCLPLLHHSVEIEGEAYWDGGLTANPPLRQLAMESAARDLLLVQIMPEAHPDVPHSAAGIARRVNAIAFSNPLNRDLEALADLAALSRGAGLLPSARSRRLRNLRLHRLVAQDSVPAIATANAMHPDRALMARLRAAGRQAAGDWLAARGA